VLHIYWNYLLLIPFYRSKLTVTVEGIENVWGDDWIEIKTEEDCIQLVGRVKCEQEVSVLWW
jgi:hypothetical protein